MAGAFGYNERKVSRDEATIVFSDNMLSDGRKAIRETFEWYERLNIRSRDVCFHMSVNPGPDEVMDDEQAKSFVKALLDGLGYGCQPYVIYRHNDIEREHFHVLCPRTNEHGRKINDYREHRKCQQILKDLCEQYGYRVGGVKESERLSPDDEFMSFNPDYGNVLVQMNAIFEQCTAYHYTSRKLFDQIARDHGLKIRVSGGKMSLQGTDGSGRKCTVPYSKPEYLSMYLDRMQESTQAKLDKDYLGKVAESCKKLLPYSKSEESFTRMMLRRGIHPVFEKDSSGKITGFSIIDHENQTAFPGTSLGHEFCLADIQQAQDHQWAREEQSHHESVNIGEFLFAYGGNSRSKEKDPKYRKPKKGIHI